MNKPTASKINWTAGLTAIATIAALYFEVPDEYMPHVLTAVGVAAPVLIAVFRTWFTEK